MRSIIQPVVAVLDRVQRRFMRSRAGSVLILTVVMVVLLALLGTALLSTTQNDRYVSAQNAINIQIDLLVEGAKNLVRDAIYGDLFGPGGTSTTDIYRPPTDTANTTNQKYDPFDAPFTKLDVPASGDLQNDAWLSSTVPMPPTATVPYVYWPAVSIGLTGGGTAQFDSPYFVDGSGNYLPGSGSGSYTNRTKMVPTWIEIPYADQSVHPFPAFALPGNRFVIAGDADGDGIADSGLIKFPMGDIDGVTYYYAYRVVDNNAKINLNTAWSNHYDFDFAATEGKLDGAGFPIGSGTFAMNLGFFPSHVGLYELLHRTTTGKITPANWSDPNANAEMRELNKYRFGYSGLTLPPNFSCGPSGIMCEDKSITPNTLAAINPRTESAFLTAGEALWSQLGRRIQNPGYIANPLSTTTYERTQAFSTSDAVSLSVKGGILLADPQSPSSTVEQLFYDALGPGPSAFPDSVFRSAPNYANGSIPGAASYDPSMVRRWYGDNFDAYYQDPNAGWPGVSLLPYPSSNVSVDPSNGAKLPSAYRSLRPLITTINATSNLAPARYTSGTFGAEAGMIDYRANPPRTNINTAQFGELWRAFWCVMADNTSSAPNTNSGDAGTPFNQTSTTPGQNTYAGMEFDTTDPISTPSLTNTHNDLRMFRSPLRDPRLVPSKTYISGKNMVLLRSAIAATNVVSLREMPRGVDAPPNNRPLRFARIGLKVTKDGVDVDTVATIFRMDPQPFITEVFAQTDAVTATNGQNKEGYVAIELYNPYDFDIDFSNVPLHLVKIPRPQNLASYPLQPTLIKTISSGIIESKGYMLLENYDETGAYPNAAKYRPASSRLQASAPLPQAAGFIAVSVPELGQALDSELVLLMGGDVTNPLDPTRDPARPIDAFDFTGIKTDELNGAAQTMHYCRPSDAANAWKFVYPGRYYAGALSVRRQQGTQMVSWNAAGPVPDDPWDPVRGGGPFPPAPPAAASITLGQLDGTPQSSDNVGASYPDTFPVQLMNDANSVMNAIGQVNPNRFPYGLFARNGDILQVPFIGAYRIDEYDTTAGAFKPNSLIELTPITMDAAFAEDTYVEDNPLASDNGTQWREQLGRFCPIPKTSGSTSPIDDFGTDPAFHAYAFARKLFDYFTVSSPSSDYLPDVNPNWAAQVSMPRAPQPVDNDGDGQISEEDRFAPPALTAGDVGREDALPIQGQININTAPWQVLAALPMLPAGLDQYRYDFDPSKIATGGWSFAAGAGDGIDDNVQLAKAIVQWRDVDDGTGTPGGPLRSLFDLYRIPAFRQIEELAYLNPSTGHDITARDGDFVPAPAQGNPNPPPDGVRRDFEECYFLMNRISNIATVRSDSFTVYVLVQGWKNVGVAGKIPELVVQRRAAFIQDRSSVTKSSNLPAPINIPND